MRKAILLLWVVVGVVVIALSPFYVRASSSSCESFGIKRFNVKKEAPPFSLKDLNGKQVSLSDFKGKPVFLFFWATWCISCKEDIVLVEKFYERCKNQFEILTLVIDGEKEARVRRAVKRYKITMPVLLDVKEKIARTYGITMVPTGFIINCEGQMEGIIVGQRAWDEPLALTAVQEVLGIH
jgi:peroxiredoxin